MNFSSRPSFMTASYSYNSNSSEALKRSGNFNLQASGSSNQGLTDLENAKIVARRIFESYDRDKDGNLNGQELTPMLSDTYKIFNRGFIPEKTDVEAYSKILDRNKDGRVNYQDIEELCVKYLVAGRLDPIQSARKEVIKRAAPPKYTAAVLQRLEVARRLFKKFDKNGNQSLTVNEIGDLLVETYKETMGMPDFKPTSEDITSFMDLVDRDSDGIVTLEDYEYYILQSLKDAGIKIEEEQMRM